MVFRRRALDEQPTVFECTYDRLTSLIRQQPACKNIGNKLLKPCQRCPQIGGAGKTPHH